MNCTVAWRFVTFDFDPMQCALGPAYIKSLAMILVITYTIYLGISILSHAFYSALFDTYRYLRRESPLATIIAPSDVSNNRSFPQRKYSIYLDWFCKSLKCNHNFLKSLGATGVFLEIISKSYKENSESRKWRRESLIVCKQGLIRNMKNARFGN